MMVAKSATWSYLKRAWDNDLTFERASRSLAKTGVGWRIRILGPPSEENHRVLRFFVV